MQYHVFNFYKICTTIEVFCFQITPPRFSSPNYLVDNLLKMIDQILNELFLSYFILCAKIGLKDMSGIIW